MYTVVLQLVVTGKDLRQHFERRIELPFVPFAGLELALPHVQGDVIYIDVEKICWNACNNTFEIGVDDRFESDCPCNASDKCCSLSYQLGAFPPEAGFVPTSAPGLLHKEWLKSHTRRGRGWLPLYDFDRSREDEAKLISDWIVKYGYKLPQYEEQA